MNNIFDENTALILVDIQNDYFQEGLYPLSNVQEALNNAKKLLDSFRKQQLLIIHVKHVSLKENANFFSPNSKGSQIHEDIYPTESELVVVKHRPDSFIDTNLHDFLQKNSIKRLVVCGMMSHHCIDTTVRTGSNDYNIFLVHDACATKDLSFQGEIIKAEVVHKTFMAALEGFSTVLSTKEILNCHACRKID